MRRSRAGAVCVVAAVLAGGYVLTTERDVPMPTRDGDLPTVTETTAPQPSDPAASHASWECAWDPTMNDDWHDDVLCTDGVAIDRPVLLPDDEFVTRDDIMQAAADYAAALNAR